MYPFKRASLIAVFTLLLCFFNVFTKAENQIYLYDIENEKYILDWQEMLSSDGIVAKVLQQENNYKESDSCTGIFRTKLYDLSDFVHRHKVTAFVPSEKMHAEFQTFAPIVQELLKQTIIGDGGRFYGYPEYVNIDTLCFWVPNAWNDSPFKDTTPPSSFIELLDFLELYLNTPHEGYCFYYDIFQHNNPQGDWLDLLIECWAIQRRSHGEEVLFNDPQFVELSERTLLLTNSLANDLRKRKKSDRQLFTKYYCGHTENGGDTFSWNNFIPWRISNNEPPLVNIHADLICVGNNNLISLKATDYLDKIVEYRFEEPALRYLYLNPNWINVDEYNTACIKKYGKNNTYCLMTQEFIYSILSLHEHAIPCSVNYFFKSSFLDWKPFYQIMNSFISGHISAGDFASQLDSLNYF